MDAILVSQSSNCSLRLNKVLQVQPACAREVLSVRLSLSTVSQGEGSTQHPWFTPMTRELVMKANDPGTVNYRSRLPSPLLSLLYLCSAVIAFRARH